MASDRDTPQHVTLDDLWAAMWEDLRHNATGKPSGDAIIARWRVVIEGAARAEGAGLRAEPDAGALRAALRGYMESPHETPPRDGHNDGFCHRCAALYVAGARALAASPTVSAERTADTWS